MILSIDQIRAACQQLPREEVDLPELGGSISVRTLTLSEVNELARIGSGKDSREANKAVVRMAACNHDGSPLFVGDNVKVIDALPWPAVKAINDVVARMNKLKGDDDASAAEGDAGKG